MNHQKSISTTIELGRKTGYYGFLVAFYDKNRFDGVLGRLKNWRDQRLVWRAVKHAGSISRVMDVPCGTGRFLRSLPPQILHSVGADVSMDVVKNPALTGGVFRPIFYKFLASTFQFQGAKWELSGICAMRCQNSPLSRQYF